MPALGTDPRGFQATGTATDDDHPTTARRGRDHVGHRQLSTGRRVVDAQRLARLVDPIEAVGRPDAWPDRVLEAELDLADEVWFGHLGAGHPDHVDQAFGDGVSSGGDVVDLRGVQHGEPRLGPDHPGEIEVWRRGHAVDRDHLGQHGVVDDAAADHVDEVDQLLSRQTAQDLQPDGGVDAVFQPLVDRHADADDVVAADPLSNGAHHLQRKAHAVLERAAVLVVAVVGRR